MAMNALHAKDTDGPSSHRPLVLSGHTGMVYSIAFLPDGNQFISGSMDGTVRTWSTKQGCEIRPPIDCGSTISTMATSTDGRWIATGSDNWHVVLWDITTHEQVGELADAHAGAVECIAFSADATQVVSGAGDATVAVWRVPTGERSAGLFRGHVHAVISVVFSPDGDRIASTDLRDIRIRDSRSGTLVLPVIELEAWSLVLAPQPNDRVIFAGCENRIKRVDVSTGAVSSEWTTHRSTITYMALSRDRQSIAVSSNYAWTVQLWSTETRQERVPALQHGSLVRCVAISPDGSHVITGGDDHTVYIWPIRDK